MFMAALLIIVPKWKQNGKNKHPSILEWRAKLWDNHTIKILQHISKNGELLQRTT